MTALVLNQALPPRFWRKVQVAESGCWLWTACLNSRGYGCYSLGGRRHLAHRVAFEALVNRIPKGLTIDHLCRVKRCVNPAHMEPVTLEENLRREDEANRPVACPQGHRYDQRNTRVKRRADGRVNRLCRACESAGRKVAS